MGQWPLIYNSHKSNCSFLILLFKVFPFLHGNVASSCLLFNPVDSYLKLVYHNTPVYLLKVYD